MSWSSSELIICGLGMPSSAPHRLPLSWFMLILMTTFSPG